MTLYRSAFSSPQDSSKWGLIAAVFGIALSIIATKALPDLNPYVVGMVSAAVFFSVRMRFSLSKYPAFWVATLVIIAINLPIIFEIREVPDIPKILFVPIVLIDVFINQLIYLLIQIITGTEDD